MKIFKAPTKAEVKERQRIWIKMKGWRGKYNWVGSFNEDKAEVMKNDKSGFVNTKGVEVIPCIYDYVIVFGFHEGKAEVKKNGEWFYIDHNGNRIKEKNK